jgi:hypothetical protein
MLPRDPSFASVTSLSHFGGVNGQSFFADQIPNIGWLGSGFASTQVVTGPSGLSEPSLNLPTGATSQIGSSSTGVLTAFPAFGFGSGLYTVDGYWNPSSVAGTQIFFDNRTGAGGGSDGIGIYSSVAAAGKLVLTNDAAVIATGTTVMTTGNWYHLQVCRDGSNNVYGFVNGNLEFTVTDARSLKTTTIGRWGGSYNAGQSAVGNINNARVTKGVCRNTTNFTKPSTPFPDN